MTSPRTLTMTDIAAIAGYRAGPDGRLRLPLDQDTADSLAVAAVRLACDGADQIVYAPVVGAVVLTGAAPAWALLVAAHALHGLVESLSYADEGGAILIYRGSHHATAHRDDEEAHL